MTALEGKALLDHGKAIAKRYAGRVGPDVAEELGAEAVMRALRSPPPDGRLEPWLERIYRNLIVDVWRRRRPAALDADALRNLATSGTPEDAVLARERRRMVRASIARLPRESRRALLSRFYGELDDEVSAGRLGIAGATIRTRIHRALSRLRGRLEALRAVLPPLVGKLGVGASTLGLAPVMVVALVLSSAAPRAPEPDSSPLATAVTAHPATHAARPASRSPHTESRVTGAEPLKRVRPATRRSTVTQLAQDPPERGFAFAEPDEVVVDIQRPDATDVFADPAPVSPSCLVESPASFSSQFEKMLEDSL
jgi:RNA polymerase sigma factor (sigma-70 family)